ncbi:uncharacterized protein N7482_007150 [Penicillium canariense]|uniref:Uncharacterized protein n=1 Tax=Penicillium canariense TaxID=189055 RepID=A0A9W9HYW9_9EURO|nr:uncharacterized protein N7482_007150 [Penicillium canariense]KAJ5160146.1 hypothetical protein N7482_007150 [Penicillium canariense]
MWKYPGVPITLVYLFGHVQAQNSTSNPLEGWQFDDASRSSWDILWTCLTTIFACTWAALHFQLPVYVKGSARAWGKFTAWIYTLIAPEIMVIYVAVDFHSARDAAAHCNRAFRATMDEAKTQETRSTQGQLLTSGVKADGREDDREWTTTHGFCIRMGGFQLRTKDGWLYTISVENIIPLIEAGVIQPGDLDEEEIKDHSKADAVAKLLAILQSVWVTINILARAALQLPICPLEISTVAYVLCAFFTYALWWCKPKDMKTPITLHIPYNRNSEEISSWVHEILDARSHCWRHPTEQTVDREPKEASDPKESLFRRSRHKLWSDQARDGMIGRLSPLDEALLTICAAIGLQAFSAIHVAAWNFVFPTLAERWAWRVISLIALIIPWISFWMAVVPLFLAWCVRKYRLHVPWLESYIDPESRRTLLEGVIFEGVFFVYYFARVGTIILMMISLRALPAGSFIGIDWLSTIPHI